MRGWLLVGASAALVYAVFGLFVSRWDFLAGALLAAFLVTVWGFLGHREDRRRRGRDEVWQRRLREARR